MKKVLIGLVTVLAMVAISNADVYTYTYTVTNNQTGAYSDQLPISGYLDKVEFIQGGADSLSTSSLHIATWNSTTAVDTYVTNSPTQAQTPKVYRPRVIGTSTAGTDLSGGTTAASAATTNIVATTVLEATYEKIKVGSNFKIKYTGLPGIKNTMTNTVRIFTTDLP